MIVNKDDLKLIEWLQYYLKDRNPVFMLKADNQLNQKGFLVESRLCYLHALYNSVIAKSKRPPTLPKQGLLDIFATKQDQVERLSFIPVKDWYIKTYALGSKDFIYNGVSPHQFLTFNNVDGNLRLYQQGQPIYHEVFSIYPIVKGFLENNDNIYITSERSRYKKSVKLFFNSIEEYKTGIRQYTENNIAASYWNFLHACEKLLKCICYFKGYNSEDMFELRGTNGHNLGYILDSLCQKNETITFNNEAFNVFLSDAISEADKIKANDRYGDVKSSKPVDMFMVSNLYVLLAYYFLKNHYFQYHMESLASESESLSHSINAFKTQLNAVRVDKGKIQYDFDKIQLRQRIVAKHMEEFNNFLNTVK